MPTPAFWKKLQKRTAGASAAFTALVVTVSTFQDHLPAILPMLLGYFAAGFGFVSAACSLAVEDPVPLVPPPAPAVNEPLTPVE